MTLALRAGVVRDRRLPMSDLQQADVAFDNAQARYDALLPREEEECRYCGGDGRVVVATVKGFEGNEYPWPEGERELEIDCPFCRSTWAIRR
jgi:hypothetical protein